MGAEAKTVEQVKAQEAATALSTCFGLESRRVSAVSPARRVRHGEPPPESHAQSRGGGRCERFLHEPLWGAQVVPLAGRLADWT